MGKGGTIIFLLILGLVLVGCAHHSNNYEIESKQELPKLFRSGYEYVFQYDGQIALGLVDSYKEQLTPTNDEAEVQKNQKSATRIQSEARIIFNSENHATLRLDRTRIGQINMYIDDVQRVQPMGMFEKKLIDEIKLRKLQLPCEFSYVDGLIERIQFHPDDMVWSKNIKRSVLNLVQLNLKPVNEQEGNNIMNDDEKFYTTKAYNVPEITVEGDCQSTYTINSNSDLRLRIDEEKQSRPKKFNVTKSIAFSQCKKIADVTFGYQSQPEQPQCIQCMQQHWLNTRREDPKSFEDNFYYNNACAQLCDLKEIKEQNIQRSTVMRFECFGHPEKNFGIKRTELVSNYIYKTGSEHLKGNKQPAVAMHTVVAAELQLIEEKKASSSRSHAQLNRKPLETDETLLYDNKIDTEEKRFYMFGDEEFGRHTPFRIVQNKVETTITIYRRIIQAVSDKTNGIEAEITAYLPRLIETLRMCSVDELEQITNSLISNAEKQQAELEKVKRILADTLALAGTHNTINLLIKEIVNQKISAFEAASAIGLLTNLPSPSDSIVEIVLQLLNTEMCRRAPALKQRVLLTIGAMIGEICRYSTVQRHIYRTQSGFDKIEICPLHKKEIYKQVFTKLYDEAETVYEKVLVLKSLGNAGIDITVSSILETIIRGEFKNMNIFDNDSVIVRIHAIDALRRLTNQMSRKIQRLLLPIFQNVHERPEIRLTAFTTLMLTKPEKQLVDQIVYTLLKESSHDVRTFVYTALKTFSNSIVASEQELARYLKIALKMVTIDEVVASSSFSQIPFTRDYEKRENVEGIILQLASIFESSQNQLLPTHMSAAIHTVFSDHFQINNIGVSVSQVNLNRWAEKLMNNVFQMINQKSAKNDVPTRAQRTEAQNGQQADQETRNIFSSLNIKRRLFNVRESSNISPFGMICFRVGDVDKTILSFDEQWLPETVKMILNNERPSLVSIGKLQNLNGIKQYYRILSALNYNENLAVIPTSMGVPLRIHRTQPILGLFDGEIKLDIQSGLQLAAKTLLNTYSSVSALAIHKMEARIETILAIGIENMRAIEAHLPIDAELQYNIKQGLKLALQTPKIPKTRLFGLHTLTTTYTRDYDVKTHLYREAKLKTIHMPHLEQHHISINKFIGEHTLNLPLRINGHFYMPSKSTEQSILDYIVDLAHISMHGENHLHITFEPTQDTPREIELQLNAGVFEKFQSSSTEPLLHTPSIQLRNFYENNNQFELTYPEEVVESTEVLVDYTKHNEKFKNFINKFQSSNMYKHFLKLSARTVGGRKQVKADVALVAVCDARFKYCKLNTNIKRTPMFKYEAEWWALNANAEIVLPETVSSPAELNSLKVLKNQKLVFHANCQWGSEKKQTIEIRVQGETRNTKQMEKRIAAQLNEHDQLKMKREMAFLNKFDLVAKYQLNSATQNFFSRLMEVLKSYEPWNTESQLLTSVSGQPIQYTSAHCAEDKDCELYANFVIEPITQRFANLSIRTISQAISIVSIPLSFRARVFPLIRAQDKPTHSAMQLFSRFSDEARAKCSVDGRQVKTFDGVEYVSPITNCYSILAKDCGSEQPKFSVLMKSLSKEQKKIKVLTRSHIIECEPNKDESDYTKLTCKLNNLEITQKYQKQQRDEHIVEYNNEEQTSVDVNVDGVRVRFSCLCADCKCQKADIKLAEKFKYSQCGLCGHYDDTIHDEFRMGNDEHTNDLAAFHRSYLLSDKKECSKEKQNEFYLTNRKEFGFVIDTKENWQESKEQKSEENQWKDGGYASDEDEKYIHSSESSFNEYNRWNAEDDLVGNRIIRHEQNKKRERTGIRNKSIKNRFEKQWRFEESELRTIVTEYNHRICFSIQPVKQCPEGTRPIFSNVDGQYTSEEDTPLEKFTMSFACLKRTDSAARRMQRQARSGVVIDVSEYQPNYEQQITPVKKCIAF